MKKICLTLSLFILVSSLCFPSETNIYLSSQYGPSSLKKVVLTPSLFEFDSGYMAQKLRDIEKANSLQKTGRLLFIGGGLLTVMGTIFFIGSKKFGGACCEQKYKNWGYLFMGTGSVMVVGGLIMTSKGKRLEMGLALHLDPTWNEAAIGYRLVF